MKLRICCRSKLCLGNICMCFIYVPPLVSLCTALPHLRCLNKTCSIYKNKTSNLSDQRERKQIEHQSTKHRSETQLNVNISMLPDLYMLCALKCFVFTERINPDKLSWCVLELYSIS